MSQVDAWIGRELDGRYVIEHGLGEGGMGVVMRGKHKFTGVPVAIKILRRELQLDADVQARFLAEAQAPNAIGHPAIVKVLDAGRSQEGQLYMVMELLTGRSLRVPVHHRQLSPDQVLRIVLELLTVLGHAHGKGFVHRDLKPDNVFLCAPNDEVKLLDFGIAKVLSGNGRTMAGALLGTPAYMAPEQLADARNVDARADLWAVGVMLYEMVAGRLPIHGTTPMEIMQALAAQQLIPIRQLVPAASPELEAFFARALAPDPRMRFGAAAELAQALGSLALPGGSAPTAAHGDATVASVASPGKIAMPMPSQLASPYPTPPPIQPTVSSGKKLAIGGLVAVGLIAIIAIVAATRGGSSAKVATTTSDAATNPDPEIPAKPEKPDDPSTRDEAACEDRCARLMKQCGTRLGSCVADCLGQAVAFDACFDRSMKDCLDGARCGFAAVCGGRIPSGDLSCREGAVCEANCTGGSFDQRLECACNCSRRVASSHTLELARLNACGNRCAGDQGCEQRACMGFLEACR